MWRRKNLAIIVGYREAENMKADLVRILADAVKLRNGILERLASHLARLLRVPQHLNRRRLFQRSELYRKSEHIMQFILIEMQVQRQVLRSSLSLNFSVSALYVHPI